MNRLDSYRKSQSFLDRAYLIAVRHLRNLVDDQIIQPANNKSDQFQVHELRNFLEKFGPSKTPSTAQERVELVARLAYLPIAQQCVVALLRALIIRSKSGTHEFRQQELLQIADEINNNPQFSQNLGLSPTDARQALEKIARAFMSEIFNKEAEIASDDNSFCIYRDADRLIVQPEERLQG